MTEQTVRQLLDKAMHEAGGLRKWCYLHRISPSQASVVKNRKQPLPPGMLRALGIRRVVRYERVK